MKLNHCFATWFRLRELNPQVVVESGVWRGQSTWLIEQALPEAKLYCLDVNFSPCEYKSEKAIYWERDFSQCDWSNVDTENAVCFFDDHQNSYARVRDMYFFGFRHGIFDDNFPCGEGDNYSLRHMLAGVGHPRIQMSAGYKGSLRERAKMYVLEKAYRHAGARQEILVQPNSEDRKNFGKVCESYFEFPPVAKAKTTLWGREWSGDYESEPPLFVTDLLPERVRRMAQDDSRVLDYCYIAYVKLRVSL